MASISGTELVKDNRYHVLTGREQARNVIYRGAMKFKGVVMLVFEGSTYHLLVEPEDIVELVQVRRRYDL